MPRNIIRALNAYSKSRAISKFSQSRWIKEEKRWKRFYLIYPPKDTPFLPSDEALKTVLEMLTGIHFKQSFRYCDRDLFLVWGENKNLFTARADVQARSLRRAFLARVANMALKNRDVPEHVQEECASFLASCGFVDVFWDGASLSAHDATDHIYRNNKRAWDSPFREPFRRLERVCKPILPFRYEAAPT